MRTYVFAGPAILGWLWHTYNDAFMTWPQRDPSGASVRGNGEQELDPLGADAGTFATSVPPTEDAIISPGNPYNPAHQNFTYSVDGIRMPVEDFVHHAGFILKDWLARKSAIPIGRVGECVSFGHRREVIYDANGKVFYEKWWYDPELSEVSYGNEYGIFRNAEFNLTLIPQDLSNLLSNVSIVNTGGDTELEKKKDEVLKRIDYMARSIACNEAFERAKLKTPFQIVQDGLTLVSRRALTDSSYNEALGISESTRKTADTSNAPAQTIRPQFTKNQTTRYCNCR